MAFELMMTATGVSNVGCTTIGQLGGLQPYVSCNVLYQIMLSKQASDIINLHLNNLCRSYIWYSDNGGLLGKLIVSQMASLVHPLAQILHIQVLRLLTQFVALLRLAGVLEPCKTSTPCEYHSWKLAR